ncbi:hypothetical protein ABC977_02365 [Thioalkalicoccus limnaeus]|uniref:Uncharacterized protein n=1 Tax=Thioalkalicoccus limnaeus TaxID=120681 RepID=A0ABV4BD26_9GAMM
MPETRSVRDHPMMPDAPLTDLASLRRQYDGFPLDAYGVLLDRERAQPAGARGRADHHRLAARHGHHRDRRA